MYADEQEARAFGPALAEEAQDMFLRGKLAEARDLFETSFMLGHHPARSILVYALLLSQTGEDDRAARIYDGFDRLVRRLDRDQNALASLVSDVVGPSAEKTNETVRLDLHLARDPHTRDR